MHCRISGTVANLIMFVWDLQKYRGGVTPRGWRGFEFKVQLFRCTVNIRSRPTWECLEIYGAFVAEALVFIIVI